MSLRVQMTFVQALSLPAHRHPDRLCRGVVQRVPVTRAVLLISFLHDYGCS
jgi:hypothetical protein